MKKILVVISLGIGLFTLVIFPKMALAQEQIKEFSSALELASDSSFIVVEKIVYDFGALERHGITRDIPYRYKRSGTTYNVRFNIN